MSQRWDNRSATRAPPFRLLQLPDQFADADAGSASDFCGPGFDIGIVALPIVGLERGLSGSLEVGILRAG